VRNLYNSSFFDDIMRKRSGAIIFSAIVITVVCYYLVPVVRGFIDTNTALVTVLGFMIGIPSLLYLLLSEKKKSEEIQEETLEKKITTILSPISGLCLGRDTELSKLEKDLKHKNVLLIKGIAGIGKTTLGLKFKDRLKKKGYQTFWRQFDSQSYEGFLLELSEYLKNRGSLSAVHLKDQEIIPEERLKIAVQELCNYPTVLFFDNFQLFEDDSDFKIFTDYLRNSHLVIMSRSQPRFLSEDYENLQYLDKNSSVELLRALNVKESQEVLEKIYEKTRGHPWSLMCFKELSRVLPVRTLLEELPDFSRKQQTYIFEQCWKHLDDSERDFLMRASVFTKPLNFEALEVCSRKGEPSEVLFSLARRFYIVKREEYYYVHDIMKDFAFSKLRENSELYIEAQREAAEHYQKNLTAENLLLTYHHLRDAGNYEEAIRLIIENIAYFRREGFWLDVRDVLRESLDFFKDERIIAHIYSNLGSIIHRLGEWDKAIEYYEKSLGILEKLGDVHGMANTYINLGLVYHDKGEWGRAIEYYEKSLEIKGKIRDVYTVAKICHNLSVAYDRKGEWHKAIEYYEKSMEIKEKIRDVHGMAKTYLGLGLMYYKKGEWHKAIEYCEKSLEISEKLGDAYSMAQSYLSLGLVYTNKGEWNEAIEYFEKSLEISNKLRDIHGMAQAYGNLGAVCCNKGEWDKALEYCEKSLEISEKLGDAYGKAQPYNNLGLIYDSKGEWDKAIEYYEKSLQIKEKLGDLHGMAITKLNMAGALGAMKEFDNAIKLYLESERTLKKLGDKFNLMKVYRNLYSYYSITKREGKAKEYHQKAEELRKQLKIANP